MTRSPRLRGEPRSQTRLGRVPTAPRAVFLQLFALRAWWLTRVRVLLVDFWGVRATRLRVPRVLRSHHVGMHPRTLPLPAKVLWRVRGSQMTLKGYWLHPALRLISMLRRLRLRGKLSSRKSLRRISYNLRVVIL